MSILINKQSRIVVQGITGKTGLFHTKQCREYGTQIVAGVTPGKGGVHVEGIPVFDTMEEAVAVTGANVSMIFVPPRARPTPSSRPARPGSNWPSASPRGCRSATW